MKRERGRLQEERKGKKGKVGRAIKFKGLKLHSFHRFVVLACLLLTVRMQGANSVLQRICSAAPSIRKPLASARLSIKCGEVPSVGDCATLHKAAIAENAEGKLASRFCALQDDEDDPEPEAEPPAATQCVRRLNGDYSSRAAKGLQTCAGRMIVDARDVYVVELKLGTARKVMKTLRSMSFILGCKYHTTCWCVSVRTVGNDPDTVVVQLPHRTFKLFDVATSALRDEKNEVTKLNSIVLKTCVVQWSSLRRGIVVKTIRNNIKPKVATSRMPASPASSSAAAASSSTDVPAVHDDDVFEVLEGLVDHDLEAEVEDTLEDEFAMGVLGVGPKGLDKNLLQAAFVVDCEDEAQGETDSAATAFGTIRSHDAYPDVL